MKTIKLAFIFITGFALFFTQGCENENAEETSAPVADFTVNHNAITVGSTADFTDQSKKSPTEWSWNFDDGTTSTSQNPSHTYKKAGTYTVSLTVTNNAGSDTDTMKILVENYPHY